MKGIKVCRYINLSLPVTAVNLQRHFSYDLFEKDLAKFRLLWVYIFIKRKGILVFGRILKCV